MMTLEPVERLWPPLDVRAEPDGTWSVNVFELREARLRTRRHVYRSQSEAYAGSAVDAIGERGRVR